MDTHVSYGTASPLRLQKSYSFRFFSSVRTSRARCSLANSSAAFGSSKFLSGWRLRANILNSVLICSVCKLNKVESLYLYLCYYKKSLCNFGKCIPSLSLENIFYTVMMTLFCVYNAGLELQILRGTHFKATAEGYLRPLYTKELGHQSQVRGHQRPWPQMASG